MKKIYSLVLLLAVLLVPTSGAQEMVEKLPIPELMESMTVEFSSTDMLLAEGWEQSSPDVWRKTLDNGAEAEIALGMAAYELARGRLDAGIGALRALESLDAEKELRLFELLLRREKLEQVELPTKAYSSRSLCTGTATFQHNYGWANFAYPFAEAQSTFTKWYNVGSATAYAEAVLCAGSCFSDTGTSTGNGTVTAHAYISPSPTWTCNASAYGVVYLSGVTPNNCATVAVLSTNWSC